jgi:predicted MFS family arabinose efflux permease
MFAPTRLAYALRPNAPIGILAAAAAVQLLFGATPFLIPEVAARYGVSEGLAAGISVAQVSAFAVVNLAMPRLLAPTGKVLKWSALLLVVANALSALPEQFWMLVGFRMLSGLAAGTLTWVVWADAMRKPRSLAGVASAGPVTALVSAPVLSALAGIGDQAVFVALAVAALPAVFIRVDTGVNEKASGVVSRSRSNRVLLMALLLLTFFGSSLFVFVAIAARETLGLTPFIASFAYSLNAATGLLGARLSSRHRRPGWWLLTLGPAVYLSAAGGQVWLMFLGMAWWGFAFWMGVPGVLKMLAARSLEPDERAGDAQAFMAFGRAAGPVLGGGLADAGAFVALAVVAGIGSSAAGAMVIGVQEGRERLPSTDARIVDRSGG